MDSNAFMATWIVCTIGSMIACHLIRRIADRIREGRQKVHIMKDDEWIVCTMKDINKRPVWRRKGRKG